MKTIDALKQLDFEQIPDTYDSLVTGITELLNDYENEQDQAFFEKEAQDNISAYLDLVKSVAPDAVPQEDTRTAAITSKPKESKGDPASKPSTSGRTSGKRKTSKSGSHPVDVETYRSKVLESHNALIALSNDYEAEESDDLEGFFENILNALNQIVDKAEESEIPSQVQSAVEPFYAHANGLEGNQRIRLGAVDETDVRYRNQAVKIIDELVKELKTKPAPTKAKEATDENKKKEKKGKEASKSEQSKRVMQKMAAYEDNIAACRAVLREHNRKKRESQPEKSKPTRLTQLINKGMALIKLTPPAISDEPIVMEENRKTVKAMTLSFMNNWGMKQVEQAEKAVDREFDALEGKRQEKEASDHARQWRKDLPGLEKIMAYEKKHNKELIEEAAKEVVDHLNEAIKRYQKDREKAFAYLQSHLEPDQLEAYLPKYIREELEETSKKNKKRKRNE